MNEAWTQVNGIWYIDPSYFLPCLEERAKLIAEKAADSIGLDSISTERLRGQRLELQAILKQLKEANNARSRSS